MKFRKILLVGLMFAALTTGCSKKYERDISKGEVINITLAEMEEKIVNKDSFAIMLAQSFCNSCREFESYLIPYLEDHHVVMYKVILDNEKTSTQENRAVIDKYFTNFSVTPGIYYVKDGEQESRLAPKNNKIDGDMLDEWVQLNKIDEKLN